MTSKPDNEPLITDNTALFVYGTLRRGFENPFARRLQREAAFLATATLPCAYLVDAGGYPGLLRSDDPAHVVSGDLFRLPANPIPLLKALDAYEGCSDDPQSPGDYVREQASIQRNDGGTAAAWIYLFNRNAARLPIVPDGDYAAYIRSSYVAAANRLPPPALCERCGCAGAEDFGGFLLCDACVEAAGSCCTEFDKST